MKTKIDCASCETSFAIVSTDEPTFCCFCGESVKLYDKENDMLEYKLDADEDLEDEDLDLDEDYDGDLDEDFEDEDEED